MQNRYNETILNEVCEKILKEAMIKDLFGNCYDYKHQGGKCAHLCGKCDPRPCGNCPQLSKANRHIMKDVLNAKLTYCENTCAKYYSCDKVAEMNDKLKELED